ncbi:MAG: hypothetical protein KGD67_12055, partial [Candidatus Lokiarchaeota archaeon]|nr:hypothetical protein [Candidatus Lokiarchaeota archaeon]
MKYSMEFNYFVSFMCKKITGTEYGNCNFNRKSKIIYADDITEVQNGIANSQGVTNVIILNIVL